MKNAGWMKNKLESRFPGEMYADDTALMAESEEELKNLLLKVKEEREKVGLKLNIHEVSQGANPCFAGDLRTADRPSKGGH